MRVVVGRVDVDGEAISCDCMQVVLNLQRLVGLYWSRLWDNNQMAMTRMPCVELYFISICFLGKGQ